jgi:hypothetical protein
MMCINLESKVKHQDEQEIKQEQRHFFINGLFVVAVFPVDVTWLGGRLEGGNHVKQRGLLVSSHYCRRKLVFKGYIRSGGEQKILVVLLALKNDFLIDFF